MTVDKLKMHSPDLTQRNIDAIAALFPTAVTETLDAEGTPVRAVDFDAVRQELSDHAVEGSQERYQLDWPGKRAAAFAANAPIAKTLRPVREESVDFDTTKNLFIEGDNLDALKLLQESYLGRVKLIYIDPPYNTGNDLVYEDDFAESSGEYLARSGQKSETGDRLVANTEANGRFHSDWLSMMYPRLRLARNLLMNDGMIAVSINDHEHANLRRLMDEIFGERCLVGELVWHYEGVNDNQDEVKVTHEYVILYGRRPGARFNTHVHDVNVRLPAVIENSVVKNGPANPPSAIVLPAGFPSELERGTIRRSEVTSLALDQDVHIEAGRSTNAVTVTSGWSSAAILRQFIDSGFAAVMDSKGQSTRFVLKSSGNIHYLKERDQSYVLSVLRNYGTTLQASEQLKGLMGGKYFSYPKPVNLIKFLVDAVAAPGDTVLDFFAGSGTTGEAVSRLNQEDGGARRFILVQVAEPTPLNSDARMAGFESVSALTQERLRRVAAALGSSSKDARTDYGFRTLRVDTTNMADTAASPDHLMQFALSDAVRSVKPDRTDEDLLFQVLLDWGLDLAEPITLEEVGGRRVLSAADDALIACFADEITDDVVQAVAKRHPLRAVFVDASFVSDSARINAEQIFREMSPETMIRTI